MPFGNISVNSKTFEPRSEGTYQLTGISFGSPTNEFRIRPAATPGKDGLLRASIIRVLEKDIVVGSSTVRKAGIAGLNIAVPPSDFLGGELDAMVSDISEFITAGIISRVLSGER